MKNLFNSLAVIVLCLAIGLTGARAQSEGADFDARLRALLASLQSATGNFLAGEEALSHLDTKHAAELLGSASLLEPDNPYLAVRTFHAQAAQGQIEIAAKTARRLLEMVPDDELSKLMLGTVALKQRQYKEAIKLLDGIDGRSVVGITAAVVRGWAFVGDNRYAEAVTALDALAETGIEGFLTYHRALMADVADQREEALAFAEQAHAAEPYEVRFLAAYARMLANASRFAEAQNVVQGFHAEGLIDPELALLDKDLRAGHRPGKLAPNAQAGAAEIFNSVGGALSADGSSDLATIFLRLAVYLVPDFDLAAFQLGGLYDQFGQYDLSDAIYEALPADSPYKPQAKVRLIRNIAGDHDQDDAINRLHDAVIEDPDNLHAVVAWADMLRDDERWTEAARAYSIAIGLVGGERPQDWRYYYLRGMCNERARNWGSAEKDFERALELDPDNPQVLNYLGYSWIDQGVHLDKALEMIRTALEWDPSDGYVVDSLGWAYYRLGRFEEAVQTLEQAVQLRASDPAINDHLGDAYWRTGRKLEARFQWTIAFDLDPGSDIGVAARKKLDEGLEAVETVSMNG
ncbi:MAG: tetratricopeptide repeat protein [Alphaproteobacteria bacterium]|nr:tetratricopeptide repeat protein [Alphaproteobacteria bacterium]